MLGKVFLQPDDQVMVCFLNLFGRLPGTSGRRGRRGCSFGFALSRRGRDNALKKTIGNFFPDFPAKLLRIGDTHFLKFAGSVRIALGKACQELINSLVSQHHPVQRMDKCFFPYIWFGGFCLAFCKAQTSAHDPYRQKNAVHPSRRCFFHRCSIPSRTPLFGL
jgi:hypothetical protein